MGSFDLYDGDVELPTEGMPHGALASAWDVPPSKSRTIKYRFDRGKVFKLGGLAIGPVRKGVSTLFWRKSLLNRIRNQSRAKRH